MKCAQADLKEFDLDLYNRRQDNDSDRGGLLDRLNIVNTKLSDLNSQEIAENAGFVEKIRALKGDLPEHPTRWRSRNRQFFDNWEQKEAAYDEHVRKIEEAEGQKVEAHEKRQAVRRELGGLLEAVDHEQDLCSLKNSLVEEQRGRNTILLAVIQTFRRQFPIPDSNQHDLNTKIHSLCCLHWLRHHDRFEILKAANSKTLHNLDKISILKLVRAHDGGLAQGYARLKALPRAFLIDDNSLERVIVDYRDDNRAFLAILNKCKELRAERKIAAGQAAHSSAIQPLAQKVNPLKDYLEYDEAWLVNSPREANEILEKEFFFKCLDGRYRGKTVWTFLFELVTQPDIFQGTQAHRSFRNRKVLLHWINNAIEEQISMKQIEAFVLRCHWSEILFQLEAQYISAIEHGWELYDEVLINPEGPARRLRITRPDMADEIEKLLCRSQHALGLDGAERDVDENWLLDQLNERWKKLNAPQRVDRDMLHNCLVYFSSVGRYFRM